MKGGSGKSTVAVNLAGALAATGLRVLVVDTDPQGAAGAFLGVPHAIEGRTLYEALWGTATLEQVAVRTSVDGLDVVPANLHLSALEVELPSRNAGASNARPWQSRLADLLDRDLPAGRYDVVVIDTPPGLGVLPVLALTAAEAALVVARPLYSDVRSLDDALATLGRTSTEVLGVVPNNVGRRTLHQDEALEAIAEKVGAARVLPAIPSRIGLADAGVAGEPVTTYDTNSDAAQAFAALAQEVTTRAQLSPSSQRR